MLGIEVIKRIYSVHKLGYVYRDIKPENIMISNDYANTIYLIDFGLSKAYLDHNGKHIPMI